MSSERYRKALAFILSRQHFGVKLGLENIRRLAADLGNPHEAYPIVHVAGTNGKGSTASFIAAILAANGYKVGLFTSPHLSDFRERIRIDGRKITTPTIAAFVERYRRDMENNQVTFFEATTAMAMWHFARQQVDIAVLETGLGGRLDATNIVTPIVTVITNIAFDHMHILGRTIYTIAGEKAGIIKPGVPLVTGVRDDGNEAAVRFHEVCRERRAPVRFHHPGDYEYWFDGRRSGIRIRKGPFAGISAPVSLAGRHQADNAFLAVRTAAELKTRGFRIARSSIKAALSSCYWPGRFMPVHRNPTVIIDAGHNPAGFTSLAATLRERFPGRTFDFLIGMVEKKRGEQCLALIAPLARSITVVPMAEERSDDPWRLISKLGRRRPAVRLFPTAQAGYDDLMENCRPADIIIIAGSHFLIGELAGRFTRDGF
jgi:dihydrofolate synthase/folylpolyglutamate synthase